MTETETLTQLGAKVELSASPDLGSNPFSFSTARSIRFHTA